MCRRLFSLYLPLYPNLQKSARKGSVSRESDAKAKKEREQASRASVESSTTKRRSTMNSRQAFDDEETLRRVIEESKVENEASASVVGSRRGKRGRDDSEE